MARALVSRRSSARTTGVFSETDNAEAPGTFEQGGDLFVQLISVTFSAFDPFDEVIQSRADSADIRYFYIGLHRPRTKDGKAQLPKSPTTLKTEFVGSLNQCRRGVRKERWQRVIAVLETDPLFKDAEISQLIETLPREKPDEWTERVGNTFHLLSSGHKIVLLTITRLVETVEERTLILLDEPEAHLHPPLLSAFVRSLSNLLIERNGVAIVATHSPVVLQEVPKTCAWKLRRVGTDAVAERPEIETFGANVSELTREAFGFEITQAGFHTMLRRAVAESINYDEVVEKFDQQLGGEARAIVRGLIATRDSGFEE
jgi:hypothetical protein